MVEMIWTKLVTPQPVTEPVSDARVRNEIFRCRGNEAKQANLPQFLQPVIEPAGGIIAQVSGRKFALESISIDSALFQQRGPARPLYLVLTGVYA